MFNKYKMVSMIKLLMLSSFIFAFLFFIYPTIGKNTNTLVLLNMPNEDELPRNFRICMQDQKASVSASGQFSELGLKKILSILPTTKVTIIDLREESHGFINGEAVSWHGPRGWGNRGKTFEKIVLDEFQRLVSSLKQPLILAYKNKTIPYVLFPKEAYSEEELATSCQVNYLRLPVTDHCRPSDEVVDQFVNFVKSAPDDEWLHFHCSAGRGRTTTFLAMYEMIKNPNKLSFEQILDRQVQLGGIHLVTLPADLFWKHEHAEQRADFIRNFYQYCQERPNFDEPWSSWYEKKWASLNE